MTYAIDWTDNAWSCAMSIADYLAKNTSVDPEEWVVSLFDRVEQLAAFPRLGQQWPRGNDPRLRQLVHASTWVVIYEVDDTARRINVLAVRHGAQRPLDPGELP